ncbi:MAG: lytic transglycosylase domain-containing protein [Spirochaetaceae bacterium]|nr:MAG: lytic transglycosylase domain-containing protein [Spirochaetaceae bacterium]
MAHSCQGSYFGVTRDEFVKRLEAQDYDFLNSTDLSPDRVRQAADFGPGTLYYLSFIFRQLSRHEMVEECLRGQWESGAIPYEALTAAQLASFLVEREKYSEAEDFAREALARYKQPAATPAPMVPPPSAMSQSVLYQSVKESYITALYWQKKDREVLAFLKEHFPIPDDILLSDYPEVFLYKAVSSGRQRQEGWNSMAMTLFLKKRRNEVHTRYMAFLTEEKGLLESFQRDEQEIIRAKAALAGEKYTEAATIYNSILGRLAPGYFSGTSLLFDFGVSCVSGKPAAAHVQLILAVAKKLEGQSYWEAIEQAGKVSQAARDYATAYNLYKSVFEKTPDMEMKKRALWRIFDISLEADGIDEKTIFLQYIPLITDTEYYTDVIDEFLTDLVRKKDYAFIIRLAPILQQRVPVWLRAKVSYLAGRSIIQSQGQLSIPVKNAQAAAFFKDTISSWPQGYYAWLSIHLLAEETAYKKQVLPRTVVHSRLSEQESILLGFLKFGLYSQAYDMFLDTEEDYPESFYSHFADQFGIRRQFFQAIQVLELLRDNNPGLLSERDFLWLYPRGFQPLVVQFAQLNGLDETLVYSLVRRESAFSPSIVSSAGAVGLAQLMPETARGIAANLKITSYNLENPEDNLRFGTWFIADLKKRFITVPLVLSGYNAGPAATKRFRDSYGNLPDDLFVEAIDFAETRNFIKNIFANHVMYSILYSDKPIKNSVDLFFRF